MKRAGEIFGAVAFIGMVGGFAAYMAYIYWIEDRDVTKTFWFQCVERERARLGDVFDAFEEQVVAECLAEQKKMQP